MKRVIILGGGMVGSTMAMDLASDANIEVTLADIRPETLRHAREQWSVKTVERDLSDPAAIRALVDGYDLVIGALASRLGLAAMRAVIEAGCDYCDISFMEEDPRQLSALAAEKGVTVVYDCGVAPGMSNLISGWAAKALQPCEQLDLYVGGVPEERRWPFEYKAGFAPSDVLEEYTRPARLVEHGKMVIKEPLSEVELLDFPGVGTLEAFNTDGLRSLADTLDVPHMKEKTMRWPGHADLMRIFRETGFFQKETITVRGQEVSPLEVTSALLFPKWKFAPKEADVVVLRIVAEGRQNGQRVRHQWDMVDRYDPETDTRSMSRTTGFPATIMARLILAGTFRNPGVHPPEVPGQVDGILDIMIAELAKRGVEFKHHVTSLESA